VARLGSVSRPRRVIPQALASLFPRLAVSASEVTSPKDIRYNCVAFALGDTRWWYEPENKEPGVYWPPGIPDEQTLSAYFELFEANRYARCESSLLEPGFEKVAVYAAGDRFKHVAKQSGSGIWTSKLGKLEDIEHESLDALETADYGTVVAILKRSVSSDSPPCLIATLFLTAWRGLTRRIFTSPRNGFIELQRGADSPASPASASSWELLFSSPACLRFFIVPPAGT
jgi:hypothetical protein